LFSSDLVFDGRQGNYDESAPPNPLSVYAETKVAAE
jgi:dTDP-4-dehydrorhamnose reductase